MELISKDALEAKLMLCMDMNRADWSYNKMIMANKMLEILDQEPIAGLLWTVKPNEHTKD